MELLDLAKGQFLQLSRFNPDTFNEPMGRLLPCGDRVNVLAPGIICIEPVKAGSKHIILSCGVHGNETAPIEICSDILDAILTGSLQLKHRLLLIFGNLPAMNRGERFIEENMNRLFSGAHQHSNNAESRRARQLEEVVVDFFSQAEAGDEKLHYDLHTAIRDSKNDKFVVMPFLEDGRVHSAKQFGFLAACGINTFLLSSASTTTFSYFSTATCKARGFTVELGKVRPFGQNDMSRFAAARASLIALISEDDFAPQADLDNLLIYRVNQVINRNFANFKLHFDDDTPNFTDFKQGEVLASETERHYIAEYDGEAIVFPNAEVALGQRALLTVVPTTVETLDV